MMKDVEVTGRFSKLVYQFPIRIPERPGFFHGHEAVEWCPEELFFVSDLFFFFRRMTIITTELLIEERKPVKQGSIAS